ncbi:MAG: tetratricopeptide repeat protein [Deltaproteobacteria bacterium]|nr:tetratricopeptide repeat protein [Deltaproteobacteria bacterium]
MKSFFDEKPVRTCLLLFALSFLFYLKSVGFDFLPSWDDGEYVLDNTRVHGLTLENLRLIFTTAYFSNYAPLHLLSYAIDFSIWGLSPAGFHLTNIILHGVNSFMVYLLVRKLAGDGFVSFVAASFFAFHPLNVENAAWVSERKTLLTAFFSFASILAYVSFREKGARSLYFLSLFLFALSLLSKPLTVVLPLVLASYELFLRKEPRALKWTPPFFALAFIFALAAFRAHSDASAIEGATLAPEVLFGVVYPTMLPVYWEYVRLIFWPTGLSGFYDVKLHFSFLEPAVLASAVSWAAAFALVLWKGSGPLRFWFLWFWAWLLPVSNIIPLPVYYADRYMYMPAIGFFVLFGLLVSWLGKRAGFKAAASVAAVVIIALGVAAFFRMDVWKNEVAFWEDTAKKSPGQDKAHLNLGYAYEMEGRFDEAEKEYLAALAIYRSPEAVSNLEMVRIKKAMKGR